MECSANHEAHISKNIFGFDTINYYIAKPFTNFGSDLTAKIEKQVINPLYVSPLLPEENFEHIHSEDFQIDNHLFLRPTA